VNAIELDARARHFAEETGLLWESLGAPRMSGRIIGWLLVCEPAEQTAAQIAEALSASKGSISTNTRALILMGLIDKVAVPGERSTRLRLSPGAWRRSIDGKGAQLRIFADLAGRGLETFGPSSPSRHARLSEMHDIYTWFTDHYPKMLAEYDEWKASREPE
jgi:hypothetical protein